MSDVALWLTQKEFDVLSKQPKTDRETIPLYTKLESQNEIIEKCAQVAENAFDKNSANWIVGHAFAEQIRLLKE